MHFNQNPESVNMNKLMEKIFHFGLDGMYSLAIQLII